MLTFKKNGQKILLYSIHFLIVCFLALLFINVKTTTAQTGLTLSVTPTLFEMSAEPGQSWKSSLRVINSNAFDITVHATAHNFVPKGDVGHGELIPISDNDEGLTLAEWINIDKEPILIPQNQSVSIPISVSLPESASPGGHYAAILISTQPPSNQEGSAMVTTQAVTSLFFVRVAGDVVESGLIRSFRSTQRLVQRPVVNFELRFENRGNVHIQPQGDIVITNMWGKERGIIPINRRSHFGNVLPDTIRAFNFGWEGVFSLTDIGRYKAEVSLVYGQDQRQFATATSHFWVLPVKGILVTLGVFFLIVLLIVLSIRKYVKHMLNKAGFDPNNTSGKIVKRSKMPKSDLLLTNTDKPQTQGSVLKTDLWGKIKGCKFISFQFIYKSRYILLTLVILINVLFLVYFFTNVMKETEMYKVTIGRDADKTYISSEQIEYERANRPTTEADPDKKIEQPYKIKITNSGAETGSAARLKSLLESKGFYVNELNVNLEEQRNRTVIIYSPQLAEEALQISATLDGALLSATPENHEESVINIILGNDHRTR